MLRRIALLLLPLVAAAACGGKETPPPPAAPPAPQQVAIRATDFAFAAPDTIRSGVTTITLENAGTVLHHAQLVKLDSGKTDADLREALNERKPMPWATFVSGPNAPDPGSKANATIDLAPGSYVIMCAVDIPGGVPHFDKGMMRPLVVIPAAGPPAAMPASDVKIVLADYSFSVSMPLTAGTHTIEVTSNGPQPHEVEIVRFAPGKAFDDFTKWVQHPVGRPPASAIGGASTLTPGRTAQFTVTLTPGDYALLCFVPDAKDGKSHIAHGMVQTFKIN